MSGRTALITGVAGQDGSYLSELLIAKGYRVVGVPRPGSADVSRISHLLDRVELKQADLLDGAGVLELLREVQPDEVYNLAGLSFVPSSWDQPDLTGGTTGLAVVRLLDAIRSAGREIRLYQASSSEIFGNALEAPQSEATPPNPRNPYGEAKALAHRAVRETREEHGLFAVSGILYNHESPRRGPEFLTRKVTMGVAMISLGLAESLPVGSLDARRDWGFAGDYVEAMWRMLQQDKPGDYVVATGELHTVGDVCEVAFGRVGLDYREHIKVDPAFVRPPELVPLVGDASKARKELGWTPEVSFERLIQMMVDADVERLQTTARTYNPPR